MTDSPEVKAAIEALNEDAKEVLRKCREKPLTTDVLLDMDDLESRAKIIAVLELLDREVLRG